MNLQDLKFYAKQISSKYPELQWEINDFVQLAIDNVDVGESEFNEAELAIESIDELIILQVKEINN